MPRKTFTAGEVLAAADVNTFLMDQSVMTFAGTAARGSAIGTATEGMLTYLEDTDAFEYWDGSAFTGLIKSGLDLVNSTTFSAVASQSLNDVFTSEYQNYKILLNVDSVTGTNVQMSLRLRAAGTDASVNYRSSRIFLSAATTVTGGQNPVGTDEFLVSGANYSTGGIITSELTLFNPQQAKNTGYQALTQNFIGAPDNFTPVQTHVGAVTDTVAYDGFTIIMSSGNFSGTIRVYGFRS
jgi:hypothetical protein